MKFSHPGRPVCCEGLERRVLLAAAPAVTSFTLINADTDQPLAGMSTLTEGATLNLSTLPTTHLNVRANVPTVGSVRFAYDGSSSYRIENGAPYALAGNSGSDY